MSDSIDARGAGREQEPAMPLAPLTTRAPDNTVEADVDTRLTRLVENLIAQRRAHHVSLALVGDDGRRRWSAVSARADTDPQPGPDTPFFIASITKRLIVTLVLQAHERGELDLAAPISNHLPAEALSGLHVLRGTDRTPEITVRHLASHTSGLPDHFEKRRDGPGLEHSLRAGRDVAWGFEDMLHTTREQQRPHFQPQDLAAARQKARYSDTGFQLLIRVLEAVTGDSFGTLLARRITGPLELTSTWLPAHPRPATAAAPLALYTRHRRAELTGLLESSNDLFSTTGDLITFQRALLAGELFSRACSLESLTERRNRLRNIPVLRYGLGTMFFRVNRAMAAGRRPVTLIGHSGATGTWLFHCPELDVHLVGTVDRTDGHAIPFQLMTRCLAVWRK
ncbi:hypothetical protein GCM10027570_12750 [Streptomonospora sediminis]